VTVDASVADLALREPTLEWAYRSGSGLCVGLGWVDATIHPDFWPLRQLDVEGRRQFRHYPYSHFLPRVLTESMMAAQADNRPTAWEAMLLVFARTEWLMASLEYLWTPFSPTPALLASLVETYGVEPAIHRRDPDYLRRLTALLPTWHPYRGTVARARDVLRCCDREDQLASAATLAESGPIPSSPGLAEEAFVCHVGSWWRLREQPKSRPEYRITGGVVRFQPVADEQKWVLRKEDVLIELKSDADLPRAALRLLPAWAAVRVVVPTTPKKKPSTTKKKST
jgi:hypothetical protein